MSQVLMWYQLSQKERLQYATQALLYSPRNFIWHQSRFLDLVMGRHVALARDAEIHRKYRDEGMFIYGYLFYTTEA